MPSLRKKIIDWYRKSGRDLPWRHTRDPYAIWVSEIMLQQTRVETVIPYYGNFIKRFPTLKELADATEDEVLSFWSGLGYYRRARLLHKGVRQVVTQYGGQVPEDPAARNSLPGVGRYTAGAIGSFAFHRAEPLVDGNVARVFSRLFLIETPLGSAQTNKRLWSLAEDLVRGKDPQDFNQGLMELGALVCTQLPRCARCPVRSDCLAYARGNPETLPVRQKKPVHKEVRLTFVVPWERDRVWLQRGQRDLYGGMWAPPFCEGHGRSKALRALQQCGLKASVPEQTSGSFAHVLTHRKLDVQVWFASVDKTPRHVDRQTLRSFSRAQLRSVGVSALVTKMLQYNDRR